MAKRVSKESINAILLSVRYCRRDVLCRESGKIGMKNEVPCGHLSHMIDCCVHGFDCLTITFLVQ